MSALLERAAGLLAQEARDAAGLPRFAPRGLVLGRSADAIAVAAALAGGLRERDKASAALLVTWPTPARPRPFVATPAASRLAARLQARGLEAIARGRLAWLALRADELPLAARALAAVDVPAATAVTGPRTDATDDLLAEQDLVVLVIPADAEPELEPLARAGLAHCPGPILVQRPLDSPGTRTAALAGWGRLRVQVPGA